MTWNLLIAFSGPILLGIGAVVLSVMVEIAKRPEKRQGAPPPTPPSTQQS